jgi:hypothetical protein
VTLVYYVSTGMCHGFLRPMRFSGSGVWAKVVSREMSVLRFVCIKAVVAASSPASK